MTPRDNAARPRRGAPGGATAGSAEPEAGSFASAGGTGNVVAEGDGLHRLLVESVRDYAIFALDAGGHILSWNEGAQRINGYTADEIIGRHFSTFYPEEDIAAGKPPWGSRSAGTWLAPWAATSRWRAWWPREARSR